ncbi:VOC family protein [Oleiharenicola lentus]|jgi:catechol 2,3-dioxygenase-like lactoylglutathione lyase family enzyme|uniref:VOC family protein n=1 Tax=Oleiharenicola lentus TaxID=2508720 RepID=A0A4Q1C7L8_9BACT|nr:VOC family protein [Oleiharenicola lentus]RXK54848.1 VOC family protein [Oleiharenicola lentus]
MLFEHMALNVNDVRTVAAWYVAQLGLQVVRSRPDAPYTHFLADDTGRVFLELYSNPINPVPDYRLQHPLRLHLAFAVTDARAERTRLEQAGATLAVEEPQPDGSLLIMMRDPWGVPVQLCQRTKPLLKLG